MDRITRHSTQHLHLWLISLVPRPKFFAYVTRRKDGSVKNLVRPFVFFVTLSEKNRPGDEASGWCIILACTLIASSPGLFFSFSVTKKTNGRTKFFALPSFCRVTYAKNFGLGTRLVHWWTVYMYTLTLCPLSLPCRKLSSCCYTQNEVRNSQRTSGYW